MPEVNMVNEDSGVEKLLRERAKLDDLLRTEHTRTITIFFCDIMGFTTFTERAGDIAGRALVQRVNDIVIPAITRFNGRLVKTIGDAVMACFEDPAQAVRFAIQVQQELQQSNGRRPPVDQVHIRIGLNRGEVIVDRGDLYGDAVNVAARIEPQAQADGILISHDLYQAIRQAKEFDCRFAKQATMKGKAEPVALYQVVWDQAMVHDYGPSTPPQSDASKSAHPLAPRVGWAMLIMLVAALGLSQILRSPGREPMANDPYVTGYAALKVRDLPQATAHFSQLPADDHRQSEARAALSLWQRDYPKTQELVGVAMEQAGDRIYVHVMQGDILLQSGQAKEAALEYQKALALTEGLDWHRAMAYNGLGRLQANRNELAAAQQSLAEAARLSPDDAEILTNAGMVLSRAGKDQEAEAYFQRAVKTKPDDLLARQMLKQLQDRERLAADQARQERIDHLVEELVTQYHSPTAKAKPVQPDDREGSPQHTLWLVGLEEKGDLPVREGEKEVFLDLLGQELQNSGKLQMVERQMLDKLLAELRLGSSALTDQETALTLGRLAAARLLLNGRIFRQGAQTLINLKVIETETSKILASLSVELKAGESLLQAAGRVAHDIIDRLTTRG